MSGSQSPWVAYRNVPAAARHALDVTYDRRGVEAFWNARNRRLGAERPRDLWRTPEGQQQVLGEARTLAGGMVAS